VSLWKGRLHHLGQHGSSPSPGTEHHCAALDGTHSTQVSSPQNSALPTTCIFKGDVLKPRGSFLYCKIKHQKMLRLCVLCGSQNKQPLFPYTILTDWFLSQRLSVFTARYWRLCEFLCVRPSVCVCVCVYRYTVSPTRTSQKDSQ
jgi:hypothetical protein